MKGLLHRRLPLLCRPRSTLLHNQPALLHK